MPTKVKVQAKDVSSAIAQGLKDLGLRRDQVEVTVLEHPKKGFWGLVPNLRWWKSARNAGARRN